MKQVVNMWLVGMLAGFLSSTGMSGMQSRVSSLIRGWSRVTRTHMQTS